MQETLSLPTSKETFLKLSRRERAELYEKAVQRIQELPTDERSLYLIDNEQINTDLYFVRDFKLFNNLMQDDMNQRNELIDKAQRGEGILLEGCSDTLSNNTKASTNMENLELRAFQKMVTTGMKTMTDEEQRSLNLSGSAVVIPQSIHNNLITSEKYSDLLYRATQFNDARPGKIQVPIASNNNGVFHTELAPIGEASPTLTSLELGGFEIARLLQISASASSMASPEFETMLENLLASEVLVGIEESVIKGTGTGEPKGLKNLTWTVGTNAVTATTSIKVADIASALGLLPAKYSKGAVILMNSKTLYTLAQAESTGGSYAFNLAEASEKFMGKELVLNEHIEDNYAYLVNPRELYIRWSMPLQMEVDKSAGFTSFSQYLRAAAVMDAKWNQKACVQVKVGI